MDSLSFLKLRRDPEISTIGGFSAYFLCISVQDLFTI
jgi:hypothetical protein